MCVAVVALMNALRFDAGIRGFGFLANAPNTKNLHARHQERGAQACEQVARRKAYSWLVGFGARDETMEAFYRPSTLYRPTHFDEYLAEPGPLAYTRQERRT